MDKRLMMLLTSGKIGGGNLYLLDTYNQAVHEDIACTITTRINDSNQHFIYTKGRMSEIRYAGQMSSSQNSRVIDPSGISYAMTNGEKDGTPKIIEPVACAMRGRNPENPSERGRSNGKYKQRIEMGNNISNTITSVQKDSLVAEPRPIIIDDYNQRIPEDQDVIGTVTTMFGNSAPRHGYKIAEILEGWETPPFRIRKLTERECFRLMGVSEIDIDRIQSCGVSRSQQYKMAGNSIVVDCLFHIFRKMFVDTGQESQQLSLF